MNQVFHSALAGLRASAQRIAIGAGNIVNARSGGALEPYSGYVPNTAVQATNAAGVPQVRAVPLGEPARAAYRPDDPRADAAGLVGMPNVDLPGAFVDIRMAEQSYKASLAVLSTAQEMNRVLLDREA